jgi:hypothetical protein
VNNNGIPPLSYGRNNLQQKDEIIYNQNFIDEGPWATMKRCGNTKRKDSNPSWKFLQVKGQGKSQRLKIHVDKEDLKSTTNYLQQEIGGGNRRWVKR